MFYAVVVTSLCVCFAGGFGYFFYLWWKASGFQKFIESAKDVSGDVSNLINKWQGQK